MDFETNTADYTAPDFYVRCVGLANDEHCIAVDFLDASPEELQKVWDWLLQIEYAAHFSQMERGTMYRETGKWDRCIADTFALVGPNSGDRLYWGLDDSMEYYLGAKKQTDLVKEMKQEYGGWETVKQWPFEKLGYYNAIDAFGTYHLFKGVERQVKSYSDTWGSFFWDQHREDFLEGQIMTQIEAKTAGLSVNLKGLLATHEEVTKARDEALEAFLGDPEIAPHIAYYNEVTMEAMEAKKPNEMTKSGEISKNYTKWVQKYTKMQHLVHFNTNSPKQLADLFYNRMGREPIKYTESGQPSTDAQSLKALGKQGKLLLDYRERVTELKFLTQVKNEHVDGVIRPHIKVPATISTRAGGGLE